MKKNDNKTITKVVISIVVSLLALIALVAMPNFLDLGKTEIIEKVSSKDEARAVSKATGTYLVTDVSPLGKVHIFTAGGLKFLCATHGAALPTCEPLIEKEKVDKRSAEYNATYTDWYRAIPPFGKPPRSSTYFKYAGDVPLTDVDKWVLSDPDNTKDWDCLTEKKQYYIWSQPHLNTGRLESSAESEAERQRGENWAKFKKALDGNGGHFTKTQSGEAKNATVTYDRNKQEYIIGPFNIDYIQGKYGNDIFGGIEDMYILLKDGSRVNLKAVIDKDTKRYTLTKKTMGETGEAYTYPFYEPMVSNKKYFNYIPNIEYPSSEIKNFSVAIDPPSDIGEVDQLVVHFKWLAKVESNFSRYEAVQYVGKVKTTAEREGTEPDGNGGTRTYKEYKVTSWVEEEPVPEQDGCLVYGGLRELAEEEIKLKIITKIKEQQVTMELGGHVWLDERNLKLGELNGYKDGKEIPLAGVEVTLWDVQTGKIARKYNKGSKKFDGAECRMVTKDDGTWLFDDLNTEHKYTVEYKYNGQLYQPTKYDVKNLLPKDLPNDPWVDSQATDSIRESYNNRFDTVQAANGISKNGNSYKVVNPQSSLGFSAGNYNKVYSLYRYSTSYAGGTPKVGSANSTLDRETELKALTTNGNGIVAGSEGDISAGKAQLITTTGKDARNVSDNGILEVWEEFVKQAQTKGSYAAAYAATASAMSGTKEIKNKLQFIADTIIDKCYTGKDGDQPIQYPIYDKFFVNLGVGKSGYSPRKIEGVTYPDLYPKHHNIDLGLCLREQTDLELQKDGYIVTLEINGKEHEYVYDQRPGTDRTKDWDIYLRMSDHYYIADDNSGVNRYYDRKIYKSDFMYNTDMYNEAYTGPNGTNKYGRSHQDEIKIFITYKIALFNSSNSITAKINEIVDYYDDELTPIYGRSFIQYNSPFMGYMKDKPAASTQVHYLNAGQGWSANSGSMYSYVNGNVPARYKGLYIKNDAGYYMQPGELDYLYLTFAVNKKNAAGQQVAFDNDGNFILDGNGNLVDIHGAAITDPTYVIIDQALAKNVIDIGVGKENVAEINGYTTRYAKGVKVPNIGDVSGRVAGIVDRDSTPGNVSEYIVKDKNYTASDYWHFEDDSDKAPNIKIKIWTDDNNDDTRTFTGEVFDDTKNADPSANGAAIGNGSFNSAEGDTLINGMTIQLVEIFDNDTEYIWREFGQGSTASYAGSDTNDLIGKFTPSGQGYDESVVIGQGSGNVDAEFPIVNERTAVDTSEAGGKWYIPSSNGQYLIDDYVFEPEHRGQYAFKSYIPGNYVIRFVYGDTTRTVLVSNESGDVDAKQAANIYGRAGNNKKSYNGQDYKSTVYQKYEGSPVMNTRQTRTLVRQNPADKFLYTFHDLVYDIEQMDLIGGRYSDARDITARRELVNKYSNNSTDANNVKDTSRGVTNTLAEILASGTRVQHDYFDSTGHQVANYNQSIVQSEVNELIKNTWMEAETGGINIEIERNAVNTDVYDGVGYNANGYVKYAIDDIDFGIEERAKAQLVVDKQTKNVSITLADGTQLFDAEQTTSNLLWNKNRNFVETHKSEMYTNGQMNENIYRGTNPGTPSETYSFDTLTNRRAKDKTGLIQAIMDEELMHNAKIRVNYDVKVSNIGELDFDDYGWYYSGNTANVSSANIVKTTVLQVLDFVDNNYQFNRDINAAWSKVEPNGSGTNRYANNLGTTADLVRYSIDGEDTGVVTGDVTVDLRRNVSLRPVVDEYDTIVSSVEGSNFSKAHGSLYPVAAEGIAGITDSEGSTFVKETIILSDTMTAENDSNDLTYDNFITIARTSNDVGRRMAYSVAGNDNPKVSPVVELDSDRSETITVLPPFGATNHWIVNSIIISISGIVVLAGVIIIKKKLIDTAE